MPKLLDITDKRVRKATERLQAKTKNSRETPKKYRTPSPTLKSLPGPTAVRNCPDSAPGKVIE